MRWLTLLLAIVSVGIAGGPPKQPPRAPKLIDVERIWGQAPHNASPDLILFRGRWYCALRETEAEGARTGFCEF